MASVNDNITISAIRTTTGNGQNITIYSSEAVSGGDAQTGGIIYIYGGLGAGGGADGYVKVGQGAYAPSISPTDDDMIVVGRVEAGGIIYTESSKRVACGGGSTGAGVVPNGTVTLEINGVSYYLLTSAGA